MKQSAVLLLLLLVLQACSTKKTPEVTPEQTKVKLVSPANGGTIPAAGELELTWLPPTPILPAYYKIKIVEVSVDQPLAMAICCNKPFFEKDSVMGLKYNIPATVPRLKEGQVYAWNVQALNREGKPIGENNGTSEAFTFTTPARTPITITLVTPANNSTLTAGAELKFSWTATIPDAGSPVSYKIKIVEIKGDESPDNAIHTNKPFFEKDSTIERTFTYPPVAPPFKAGTKYAWNVQALQKGKKDSSAAGVFTTAPREPIVIALLTPAHNSTVSLAGGLEFTWLPTIPDAGSPVSYNIKIVEILGDQSPENALHTNKPHFEKDSIRDKAFFYPAVGPMLKSGSKYAWRILANQKAEKDSSDAATFTISGGAAAIRRPH